MARMSNPVAIVVQRNDAVAVAGLASRSLAAAIEGRPLWVLLRLDGAALLRPAATWPQPGPELAAWLHSQEFPDLSAYLNMALDAAASRRCVCRDSLAPWGIAAAPPPWQRTSLTAFADETNAAGGHMEWLM